MQKPETDERAQQQHFNSAIVTLLVALPTPIAVGTELVAITALVSSCEQHVPLRVQRSLTTLRDIQILTQRRANAAKVCNGGVARTVVVEAVDKACCCGALMLLVGVDGGKGH